MRLCILWDRPFEDTFEITQRRKVKQMQPMWLFILSCRPFEDTFEITQRRKVKQMQPMWLYLLWGRHVEDTFKNTQWRQRNATIVTLHPHRWQFEETFENAQQRKVKNYENCEPHRFMRHLKTPFFLNKKNYLRQCLFCLRFMFKNTFSNQLPSECRASAVRP